MQISPKFKARDWQRLDPGNDDDWLRAIEIFEDRINGRFLAPIRAILWHPWSGFCVLAIDSLLVETLQQFWEGKAETPTVVGPSGCKRSLSEKYFLDFLRGALFEQTVTRREAKLFYTTVRCGILHQAEVRGSTRVRRNVPMLRLQPDGKGLQINPVRFHQAIEAAFTRYLNLLRDPVNNEIRSRFWNKMTAISSDRSSSWERPVS